MSLKVLNLKKSKDILSIGARYKKNKEKDEQKKYKQTDKIQTDRQNTNRQTKYKQTAKIQTDKPKNIFYILYFMETMCEKPITI